MSTSLVIVVVGLVFALLVGVAGVMLFVVVALWFVRRRGAEPAAPPKRKPDPDAPTMIREVKPKDAQALAPAPASPPAKSAEPASAPPAFISPPPPPPFKAGGAAGGKGAGPLLGFFDDDKPKGEEAKTELFSRDMAARMAAMLDDDEDDEGEHTELFSAADMEAEVAAMMLEEDTGMLKKGLPGRVVAEDKK